MQRPAGAEAPKMSRRVLTDAFIPINRLVAAPNVPGTMHPSPASSGGSAVVWEAI